MKKAENQYHLWTKGEDCELLELLDLGLPKYYICNTLGRTEAGVAARLRRLGVIKERKEFTKHYIGF